MRTLRQAIVVFLALLAAGCGRFGFGASPAGARDAAAARETSARDDGFADAGLLGDGAGEAALGDAALGDTALGDAALGDAALGDAALGDTGALNGPLPGIYYSVGAFAGDLKSGAPTITVLGGRARFSLPQPDNIGLGDVITYGAAGRAFITGRRSASEYFVAGPTGTPPADVSGVLVVSIRRAFASLTAAQRDSSAAEFLGTSDLRSGAFQLNWVLYNDAALDDGLVAIDGWVTGPVSYLRIFAPSHRWEVGSSQRHHGRAGSGARLVPSTDASVGGYNFLEIGSDHVRVEGIEFDGSGIVNARHLVAILVLETVAATSDHRFEGLIVHHLENSSRDQATNDGDVFAFQFRQGSSRISNTQIYELRLRNNNATSAIAGIAISGANMGKHYYYNNTIAAIDNPVTAADARGINTLSAQAELHVFNNLIVGLTSLGRPRCFDGSFTAGGANVSSDDTAPGAGSVVGATAYSSYFVNTLRGSEDLHLVGDAQTLWGIAGKDLSADPNLPVGFDMDGAPRSAAAPDIGADEYAAP